MDVICSDLGRVLAGVSGRKVLAGDGTVAEWIALERSRRLVRTRGARTGEILVGEAPRWTVSLPARRDARPVLPGGFRQGRLSLRGRLCARGAAAWDQEPEDEGRGRNRDGPIR